MTLPSSPCHHVPYHAHYLGLNVDHELSQLFLSQSPAKDDWSLHEYHLHTGGSEEQVNKITISTQLAQAEKPKEIPVPNFCTDFSDVFSEKTYDILPPHQSFNHTIDVMVQDVMVQEAPTSFSPFSLADCTLLSYFSFNDFVVIAFPDLAGDLDVQI